MAMRARILIAPLFLCALWPALPAAAQVCVVGEVATPDAAVAAIERLEQAGCLGRPACESPICKTLNKVLADKQPTPAAVAAALRQLVVEAKKAADASPEAEPLATQVGLSLANFVDSGTTAAAAWTVEQDFVLFADEPHQIDVKAWVSKCSNAPTCTTAAGQAQKVLELARLTGRVLTKAREEKRNEFGRRLDALDKQWRAYLSSSRGQYPWELALNSGLYRKTAQFDAPPTSQWIVAHPGAGYEMTRNAVDRQPSESLLLELAGMYRWAWEDTKMKQRWGGSVTLAWRDAGEGRQKLGYGVLAYLPRASTVGYVWRPQDGQDEHSLVLSADLVKFIRGTEGLKERLIAGAKARAAALRP